MNLLLPCHRGPKTQMFITITKLCPKKLKAHVFLPYQWARNPAPPISHPASSFSRLNGQGGLWAKVWYGVLQSEDSFKQKQCNPLRHAMNPKKVLLNASQCWINALLAFKTRRPHQWYWTITRKVPQQLLLSELPALPQAGPWAPPWLPAPQHSVPLLFPLLAQPQPPAHTPFFLLSLSAHSGPGRLLCWCRAPALYAPHLPIQPPPGSNTTRFCTVICFHFGGNGEVWGGAAMSSSAELESTEHCTEHEGAETKTRRCCYFYFKL